MSIEWLRLPVLVLAAYLALLAATFWSEMPAASPTTTPPPQPPPPSAVLLNHSFQQIAATDQMRLDRMIRQQEREERRERRREARAAARAAERAELQAQVNTPAPSSQPVSGAMTPQELPEPWLTLAECESSLNPDAYNPEGPWMGLFQFAQSTWESVGGSGTPMDASVAEQLKRAMILQSRSGWGPWPVCGAGL